MKPGEVHFCTEHADRQVTTLVSVTGVQYDPAEMDHMPDLDHTEVPTAWLMRARTSGWCHHRSFDPRPATPAHAADDDRQIKKLLKKLGKADDVEREALTSVRSAPFDPPERNGLLSRSSRRRRWR